MPRRCRRGEKCSPWESPPWCRSQGIGGPWHGLEPRSLDREWAAAGLAEPGTGCEKFPEAAGCRGRRMHRRQKEMTSVLVTGPGHRVSASTGLAAAGLREPPVGTCLLGLGPLAGAPMQGWEGLSKKSVLGAFLTPAFALSARLLCVGHPQPRVPGVLC